MEQGVDANTDRKDTCQMTVWNIPRIRRDALHPGRCTKDDSANDQICTGINTK